MPIDYEDLRNKATGLGFKPDSGAHIRHSGGSPKQTLTSSSLVQRVRNPSQITSFSFDVLEHQERKEALEKEAQDRAQQLNASVVAYAQSRIAQVLSDVDIAAASIRTNAFDQMGLGGTDASQEKPSPCSEK